MERGFYCNELTNENNYSKYTFLGVRIDKEKDQIAENTAENSNK
jgi:hypothetical protein